MKPPTPRKIQIPQLPKHLTGRALERLEDHSEYSGIELGSCSFAEQTAEDLVFEQVRMKRVGFGRSRLNRLRILDARFEVCDISGAAWEKARLRRAEFIGCRFLGTQMLETQLEDVLFKDCILEGSQLVEARFKMVRFENCNLRGVSFEQAEAGGTTFYRCELGEANFQGSKLEHADFRGSTISGMHVGARELQGAIIDSTQAVQIVGLLGICVWNEQDSEAA
jgi:uncharacterized protein YjbI with pentapeptide repeats